MQGLAANFAQQSGAFQAIFDSNEAHEMPLPEPWNARLNSFQKLAVLRCLRPDKVLPLLSPGLFVEARFWYHQHLIQSPAELEPLQKSETIHGIRSSCKTERFDRAAHMSNTAAAAASAGLLAGLPFFLNWL